MSFNPQVLAAELVSLAADLGSLSSEWRSSATLGVHLSALARSLQGVKRAPSSTQTEQAITATSDRGGGVAGEADTEKGVGYTRLNQHGSDPAAVAESETVEASPYPTLYCENLAGGPRHFVVNSKRVIRISNGLFEGIGVRKRPAREKRQLEHTNFLLRHFLLFCYDSSSSSPLSPRHRPH